MKHNILFIFIIFISFYSFSETLEIRCDHPVLVYNNHVGNEWVFNLKIEGQNYPINKKLNIEITGKITIVFTVEEVDKISDYGSSTLTIDPSTLDFKSEKYTDIEVTVIENRGRYAGNSALWRLRIYYTKLREEKPKK